MLPASNRGVGMNMGFPDVCLTPAAPVPVALPYPNMAMNVQAVPFSPIVKVTMMPALNMGSKIPMTLGDDAGVAHPMFKMMGAYTMGNPVVFISALPAINLTCPTTGNNMNNPIGAVLVPSATNVMYTLAGAEVGAPDADAMAALGRAVMPEDAVVVAEWLAPGVACVRVRVFASHIATRVWNALEALGATDVRALVLDLRGNPGGDASACWDLASDFVAEGTLLAWARSADGDRAQVRSRGGEAHPWPLTIWVDGRTASAAELFTAALQAAGRARVVGERTYGKASGQQLVAEPEGPARYDTAVAFELPDGRTLEGTGVEPDVAVADVRSLCEYLAASLP